MIKKFFVFSCLVFLISFAYFIYTSYHLRNSPSETENQQGVITEFKQPLAERFSTSRSAQSEQENSNHARTTDEWSEIEETLTDFEELEGTADTPQLEEIGTTVISKAEGHGMRLSPEIEAMFLDVRALVERDNAILDEREPYLQQVWEIDARQSEIQEKLVAANGNKEEMRRLYAEYQKLEEAAKAIWEDFIESSIQQRRQLRADFEQKYGISREEFADQFNEVYRVWRRDS